MSDQWVRASEIGEYVYCRRAWWLRRVNGARPEYGPEVAAGSDYHVQHGALIGRASRVRQAAYLFLVLAVAVGLIWLMQII